MSKMCRKKVCSAVDNVNRKDYNVERFCFMQLIVEKREAFAMFFLLFGFWIMLNGRWTTEIAIIGVVICALLYAFLVAFMDYSPRKEWAVTKRFGKIVGYGVYLVGEVFKSAFAVIRLIWSPKMETEPRLSSFRTRLRTDAGKVVLANSITLTPGTITVDVRKDKFLIHCLDQEFDVGQEGFDMEERVMKVEGGSRDA